jgi:hypothetical protein
MTDEQLRAACEALSACGFAPALAVLRVLAERDKLREDLGLAEKLAGDTWIKLKIQETANVDALRGML